MHYTAPETFFEKTIILITCVGALRPQRDALSSYFFFVHSASAARRRFHFDRAQRNKCEIEKKLKNKRKNARNTEVIGKNTNAFTKLLDSSRENALLGGIFGKPHKMSYIAR